MLDERNVNAVLLTDGKWYDVKEFQVVEGSFELVKPLGSRPDVLWASYTAHRVTWVYFVHGNNDDEIYCPVTSIKAIRYDPLLGG